MGTHASIFGGSSDVFIFSCLKKVVDPKILESVDCYGKTPLDYLNEHQIENVESFSKTKSFLCFMMLHSKISSDNCLHAFFLSENAKVGRILNEIYGLENGFVSENHECAVCKKPLSGASEVMLGV